MAKLLCICIGLTKFEEIPEGSSIVCVDLTWNDPVASDDIEKTAFSPGPGMGLYQFNRMPFGLTGAPGSFQRLMDKIMRGLPFVSTFIDDILVHSPDAEIHVDHLRQVFQRLADADLTVRGRKRCIEVPYTGNVFTGAGMIPDDSKVKAVQEWPRSLKYASSSV